MDTSRGLCRKVPTTLGLFLGLLLLVINPGEAMTHKTMRETTTRTETLPANRISYLTPGSKKKSRLLKEKEGATGATGATGPQGLPG